MTEDHRLIKSAKSARDGNVSEATIPEDVWLDAIAALDGHGEVRIIEVIARAILAERERCAKVADCFSEACVHNGWTEDAGTAAYHTCNAVAEAIRNPNTNAVPSQNLTDEDQPF